jgi:hypothetical protein
MQKRDCDVGENNGDYGCHALKIAHDGTVKANGNNCENDVNDDASARMIMMNHQKNCWGYCMKDSDNADQQFDLQTMGLMGTSSRVVTMVARCILRCRVRTRWTMRVSLRMQMTMVQMSLHMSWRTNSKT